MNPQTEKFRSYDDFVAALPEEERRMVLFLNALILECMPGVVLKLSYNVPFYYLKRRVCFIWPASVPWGKVALNGVQLGFCEGFRINDELNFLEKGSRKQVCSKTYFSLGEIEADVEMIRFYLFAAYELGVQQRN